MGIELSILRNAAGCLAVISLLSFSLRRWYRLLSNSHWEKFWPWRSRKRASPVFKIWLFFLYFLRESSTRAISGMEKNEIGNDPTSCNELHLVMCVEHTTYSQLCVRDFELNTPGRQAAWWDKRAPSFSFSPASSALKSGIMRKEASYLAITQAPAHTRTRTGPIFGSWADTGIHENPLNLRAWVFGRQIGPRFSARERKSLSSQRQIHHQRRRRRRKDDDVTSGVNSSCEEKSSKAPIHWNHEMLGVSHARGRERDHRSQNIRRKKAKGSSHPRERERGDVPHD